MIDVTTTASAIDAEEAARRLGVTATVVLALSADGVLTGHPERGAKGGFVVPADEVANLDPTLLEAARLRVAAVLDR